MTKSEVGPKYGCIKDGNGLIDPPPCSNVRRHGLIRLSCSPGATTTWPHQVGTKGRWVRAPGCEDSTARPHWSWTRRLWRYPKRFWPYCSSSSHTIGLSIGPLCFGHLGSPSSWYGFLFLFLLAHLLFQFVLKTVFLRWFWFMGVCVLPFLLLGNYWMIGFLQSYRKKKKNLGFLWKFLCGW